MPSANEKFDTKLMRHLVRTADTNCVKCGKGSTLIIETTPTPLTDHLRVIAKTCSACGFVELYSADVVDRAEQAAPEISN